MGLVVHSLSEFPENAERNYYIYVLRGSWDTDIEHDLKANILAMSDAAIHSNSAIVFGTEGHHFQNDVFSWHNINGEDAEPLLPAILITTVHPSKFMNENDPFWHGKSRDQFMVLVPLRQVVDKGKDVTAVMRKIFEDIEAEKRLSEFEVAKKLKPDRSAAFMDGVQLKPSFMGIGFDLKALSKVFKGS
jgi:hypothetical protein